MPRHREDSFIVDSDEDFMDEDPANNIYEVEKIVNHRRSKKSNKLKYKVVWKCSNPDDPMDWSDSENWVDESNMHCDILIDQYWAKVKARERREKEHRERHSSTVDDKKRHKQSHSSQSFSVYEDDRGSDSRFGTKENIIQRSKSHEKRSSSHRRSPEPIFKKKKWKPSPILDSDDEDDNIDSSVPSTSKTVAFLEKEPETTRPSVSIPPPSEPSAQVPKEPKERWKEPRRTILTNHMPRKNYKPVAKEVLHEKITVPKPPPIPVVATWKSRHFNTSPVNSSTSISDDVSVPVTPAIYPPVRVNPIMPALPGRRPADVLDKIIISRRPATEEVLRKEKAVVGQKRPIEDRRPVDPRRRPVEEKKKAVEEQNRTVEEKKRPVEETRRPVEDGKKVVEEIRRPVEEKRSVDPRKIPVDPRKVPVDPRKRPVEEKRDPVEETRRPVEDKRPVDPRKRHVEEKRYPVEETKSSLEETRRPVEENRLVDPRKRPVEEHKKSVEETKRSSEETRKPVEENRPVDPRKKPIEEPKKPVEVYKKPVEEPKRSSEETRRPVEEKKKSEEETRRPEEKKKIEGGENSAKSVESSKEGSEEDSSKTPFSYYEEALKEQFGPFQRNLQPVDILLFMKESGEKDAQGICLTIFKNTDNEDKKFVAGFLDYHLAEQKYPKLIKQAWKRLESPVAILLDKRIHS